MDDSTYQYINYVLIGLIILNIARRLFFPRDQSKRHTSDSSDNATLFQTYTPSTLQKYTGENDLPVLMGVKGDVFDVSAGKSFYGPGGPYSNFAGHDASRGLAKNSFDEDMITPVDQPLDLLEDLTEEEIQALNGWHDMFKGKYVLCGKLVNDKKYQ